jgi:hypothetical protein
MDDTPVMASLDDAVIEVVPETVAPLAGEVMETAGGVLSTVTVIWEEEAVLLSLSVAREYSAWEPSFAVRVFQEIV